ncbi:MAG TPA: hypothetical protein VD794_04230, partial [Flavisolibacter sp.]|nr:hypothetical protein [Flavisolibacter sp.]
MKTIFLSLCLMAGLFAGAQMKEGKVVYERTIQMQRRNINPDVANMLPRERKDHFELLFANNQSLWRTLQTAEEGNNTFSGTSASGQQMSFTMVRANELIHFN